MYIMISLILDNLRQNMQNAKVFKLQFNNFVSDLFIASGKYEHRSDKLVRLDWCENELRFPLFISF